MKKLTIKHIAPYLDYGLQFAFLDDIDGDKGTLTGLLMFGDTPNVQLKFRGSTGLFDYEDVKPILRPLSDLYNDNIEGFSLSNMITHGFHNEFWYVENFDVNYLHYLDFVDLISYHFDVFGLIEKGLAIDINTLKK